MHHIRYAAFAAATVVVLSSAARAAPPEAGWGGFYIGGHVGEARTTNTATWSPMPSPAAFNSAGLTGDDGGSKFAGGLHGGYNWQPAPAWVIGIEGDWSNARAHGNVVRAPLTSLVGGIPIPNSFTTLSSSVNDLYSLRARLGYLVKPNLLAYASGGAAWANINYAASTGNGQTGAAAYATSAAVSSTRTGITVGGGLEWAITGKWLLRGEYFHYRFNGGPSVIAQDSTGNFPGFPSGYSWGSTSANVLQLGLSYKF